MSKSNTADLRNKSRAIRKLHSILKNYTAQSRRELYTISDYLIELGKSLKNYDLVGRAFLLNAELGESLETRKCVARLRRTINLVLEGMAHA